MQIGDRIPYATGSFQPGVGTVGVSPLVSTQFQFVDTGVTVIMTPQVHSAQEVTMHLEITVSQVSQYINLGGLQQPVISQRKSTTDIRLRDGEVNLLGGLNQITNSNTLNGIPGLVDIPVLGKYLFGNPSSTKADEQLMIALVPHIVRTPDYTPENLRGIFAGSDQVVKLSYAPRVVEPVAAPAPAPAVPANPAPPAASVKPPAPAAPAAAVPVVATPGAAVTAASAAAPVAPAPATATPAAAAQAVAAPAAPAPVVATSTPAAAPPVVVPPAVAAPAKASPRAASPAVAVPAAPPAANPVPVPPPAAAASVTPPTAPAGGPASADAPAHASGLAEIAARLREPSPRFPAFEVPASGLPFGLPSAIPAPSATPSEAASAVPSGAPSTAPSAARAAAPATASATPSFSPRVRFTPETVMASNGTPFTLNVMLDNAPDASAALAPLRIHWDSAKLHLNDISPGELFSRDGVALHIEKEIHGNSSQAAGGEATLTVTRAPGSAGISGSGAVQPSTSSPPVPEPAPSPCSKRV